MLTQTIFYVREDDAECARRTDRIKQQLVELNWPARLTQLQRANWNIERKFDVLYEFANDFNRISRPLSACAKLGCSHCCNIACEISNIEAARIGKAIKRKPVPQPLMTPELVMAHKENRDDFRGDPCPFLKAGRCSIYEVRPLACRTHHNVGSGAGCSLDIPTELSNVPTFDYRWFYAVVSQLIVSSGNTFADIRAFFPRGDDNES